MLVLNVDGAARRIRIPRRGRHGHLAVRAARAPRAAQRRRDWRAPATVGDRHRPRADVHDHDRRNSELVDGVGLGASAARTLAIVFLAGFGVVTLVPALGDRLAARLSPLARFGPSSGGTGFWSGVAGGRRAGLPLRTVRRTDPRRRHHRRIGIRQRRRGGARLRGRIGGRAARVRTRGPRAERPDPRRRARAGAAPRARCRDARDGARDGAGLRRALPDGDRQPPPGHRRQPHQVDRGLGPVKRELDDLRGPSRFASATPKDDAGGPGRTPPAKEVDLPKLGEAPDFTGNQRWFNTPGGRALTLAGLRGRVVLVDFWTYTCINCIRTLP